MTFFLYADEVLDRVSQRLRNGSPASRNFYNYYHRLKGTVYDRLPSWALTYYEWSKKPTQESPEELEADYKELLERSYHEGRQIPRIVKVDYRKRYPKSKVIPLAPYEVTHWEFKDTHPGLNISAWEASVTEAQLHGLPLHPDVDRSWQVFQDEKGLTADSGPLERLSFLIRNVKLYHSGELEEGWLTAEANDLIRNFVLAAYEDAADSKGKPLTEVELDNLIDQERQTIAEKLGVAPHKLPDFAFSNSKEKLKKRGKASEAKDRENLRKRVTAKYPEYPDVLKIMKVARAEWRERDKEIKGTAAFRAIGGLARIGTREQSRYTFWGKEAQRMENDVLGRVLTHIRIYA